jgi:hypothetical protein
MDCKFSRCYCLGVYEILMMMMIDKSVLIVKRGMEHRDTHIVCLFLEVIQTYEILRQ